MKTIKEQLILLGGKSNLDNHEAHGLIKENITLHEQLYQCVSKLLISHKKFSKISKVFYKERLKLLPEQLSSLKKIHSISIKNNFFDESKLSFLIFSIDLKVANSEFMKVKPKKVKIKRKSPIPRKNKQPYVAPEQPKSKAADILDAQKDRVKFGYGLESAYKPEKVYASDVKKDKYTTYGGTHDKSILYVPGWSLEGPFTKG